MIIFINGSINSGKSTVSEVLQKKIDRCAIVEFDRIYYGIDWMPITEALPTIHRIGAKLIEVYSEEGFSVIVPYPLLKESYEEIVSNLKNLNEKIYAFTLGPNLKKATTNRGTRELDKEEVERIRYHYQIGINNPGYGTVIDNSEQNPEETANEILTYIKS